MRLNSLSTTPIRARMAGTNEPSCAMSTMRATWRRKVDLPAMFGPGQQPNTVALAHAAVVGHEGSGPAPPAGARPQGGGRPQCRARRRRPAPAPSTAPRPRPEREPATRSSAAAACATLVSASRMSSTACDSSVNTACSASATRADASSSRAASASSSAVLKRVDDASPCRRVKLSPSASACATAPPRGSRPAC